MNFLPTTSCRPSARRSRRASSPSPWRRRRPPRPPFPCPPSSTGADPVSLARCSKPVRISTPTSLGTTSTTCWTKPAPSRPWSVSRRRGGRCAGASVSEHQCDCFFVCVFLCVSQIIPTMKGPLPLPTSISSGGSMSSPFLMPSHINPFLHSGGQQCTVTLPPLYHKSGSSAYFRMDTFDALPPPLDSLDSLSINDYKTGALPGPLESPCVSKCPMKNT